MNKSNEVFNKTHAFNTLIAACMEAVNSLSNHNNDLVWTEAYYILTNILEPIIPHTAWDLSKELFDLKNFDEILEVKDEVFVQDSIVLAVTINGKKRCEIEVNPNASNEEILSIAKEAGSKWLLNMQIIKEIVVPDRKSVV